MFRSLRPHLRGQAAPHGATLLAASLAAVLATLLSACGTPGAPTPGVPPVPDGKPPAHADGRPREVLLARSLRGAAAATEIAKAMDAADLRKAVQTLELTRNTTPIWWRNEASGREFLLTPQGSFGGDHGPCREFGVDITTGKTTDRLRGTVCQQAGGQWKLML
jgi:surface antigen